MSRRVVAVVFLDTARYRSRPTNAVSLETTIGIGPENEPRCSANRSCTRPGKSPSARPRERSEQREPTVAAIAQTASRLAPKIGSGALGLAADPTEPTLYAGCNDKPATSTPAGAAVDSVGDCAEKFAIEEVDALWTLLEVDAWRAGPRLETDAEPEAVGEGPDPLRPKSSFSGGMGADEEPCSAGTARVRYSGGGTVTVAVAGGSSTVASPPIAWVAYVGGEATKRCWLTPAAEGSMT